MLFLFFWIGSILPLVGKGTMYPKFIFILGYGLFFMFSTHDLMEFFYYIMWELFKFLILVIFP